MLLVHPEAGDPPVRTRRRVLGVLSPMLDVGQLLRAAVLAPSLRGALLIQDQRGVCPAGPDSILLDFPVVEPLLTLRVVTDAPASSEDPVVALDELGECIPRRGVER